MAQREFFDDAGGKPLRLKNKVAIVTGANQGIGQVIACRIAGEGARTVIAARNELNLQRTAKKIASDGGGLPRCSDRPHRQNRRRAVGWQNTLRVRHD
ncbi:MAG: hypothetical protein CMH76_10700 [Nitrospinae bacterium]|nr:hypothetical protein [Nitrospinota bacterium]